MMLSAPPSSMLIISIEPLSRSIAALARNIPRPILSFRLEIKGSPSFSITSFGIPGPSSLIKISNLKGDSLEILKWTTTLLCAALMAFSIILITACLTLRFEVTTDSKLSSIWNSIEEADVCSQYNLECYLRRSRAIRFQFLQDCLYCNRD